MTSNQKLAEILQEVSMRALAAGPTIKLTLEEVQALHKASERLTPPVETSSLPDVLRGLIDAVRNVNIERREWYTHIAQPLQDAYRALGSTGPGLTPEEIAAARDGSPVETAGEPTPHPGPSIEKAFANSPRIVHQQLLREDREQRATEKANCEHGFRKGSCTFCVDAVNGSEATKVTK
ncbi:MAG TPA: hypothetical protein VK626_01760 [Nitrospiraceae bacterium]|nr:hypothetical protein [Nitrospiraceae bacterium]